MARAVIREPLCRPEPLPWENPLIPISLRVALSARSPLAQVSPGLPSLEAMRPMALTRFSAERLQLFRLVLASTAPRECSLAANTRALLGRRPLLTLPMTSTPLSRRARRSAHPALSPGS